MIAEFQYEREGIFAKADLKKGLLSSAEYKADIKL